MTPYIVNLTDSLIGKHRFDNLRRRFQPFPVKVKLIGLMSSTLAANDVLKMNPETLGRVLCSLETGDVMAGKKELFDKLHFSGDPGETLRELVAICLAYVINDRLDPSMLESQIPRYKSPRSRQTVTVGRIGQRHHSEIAEESDRFWCSSCNGDTRTCSCG